jgi:hypothetical protein
MEQNIIEDKSYNKIDFTGNPLAEGDCKNKTKTTENQIGRHSFFQASDFENYLRKQ